MKEDIKKIIDDNWDDCIIKNERLFGYIKIMSSNRYIIVNIDYDDENQIQIFGQNYNKDVRNYVIDKIKSLILNEIIINNEICIDKDTNYKNLFKRRQYLVIHHLTSKQFRKSPIIEKVVLFIEKNKFTNKIVKAYIIYAFLKIPIDLNKITIKFI